jgi:hypothetical protein
MQDFRVEFTASGTLTFNARSGKHDDLVLALAIACWRAYDGGAGMGIYRYYERLARGEEQPRTVVGVDLGQSRDPTAIAVVRRVPVSRVEERAPRPALVEQAARPRVETTYAPGSLEYMQQQLEQQEARQRAAAEAAADPGCPITCGPGTGSGLTSSMRRTAGCG